VIMGPLTKKFPLQGKILSPLLRGSGSKGYFDYPGGNQEASVIVRPRVMANICTLNKACLIFLV